MTDEELCKLSVVTNAIGYGMETVKHGDDAIRDHGVVDIPTAMVEIYAVVAKHVIWTLREYERQQLERGTKV